MRGLDGGLFAGLTSSHQHYSGSDNPSIGFLLQSSFIHPVSRQDGSLSTSAPAYTPCRLVASSDRAYDSLRLPQMHQRFLFSMNLRKSAIAEFITLRVAYYSSTSLPARHSAGDQIFCCPQLLNLSSQGMFYHFLLLFNTCNRKVP